MHKLIAVGPLLAMVAVLFGGCECTSEPPSTTETLLPLGERCNADSECLSGLCAELPNEPAICRKTCTSGCDPLEVCTTFGIGSGGKLRAGCVAEKVGLCQPCSTNSDCPYPADVCLSIGGASFCGRDCAFDDQCPDGYLCSDALAVDGTPATRQCIPKSSSCACIPTSEGQSRPCEVTNAHGTCIGVERCDPELGFARCDAQVPAPETCNGIDDDCDGTIDEGIEPISCGVGECRVTIAGCEGGQVPVCTPKEGSPEVCNGKDDDCDGEIDEDFDLTADLLNCGACGNACTVRNGTPTCADSACAIDRCDAGFDDCDGQYANGCEASLNTDVNHCGGCNQRCELPNANPLCSAGKCTILSCAQGFIDRDGDPANGCEYVCTPTNGGVEQCDGIDNDCDGLVDEGFDRDSDPLHCGQCNNVCPVRPNAAPACAAGGCSVACHPNFQNCDGDVINGCESDRRSDVNNCGACGNPCPARANADPTCTDGGCGFTCRTGFGDCDGTAGNGCETNTQSSALHCGACGNACPARPNADPTCSGGTCGFTCQPGFADCDGNPANGCEVDLRADPSNCGSCNNVCPGGASATCSASGCGIACSGTMQNCDGDPSNGCETETAGNVNHCLACNNACPARPSATPTCTSAGCGIECTGDFQNCDDDDINGCESNRNSDPNNCGSCGNKCVAPPNADAICASGGCSFTCKPGFGDCDGNPANGCEVDLTSDLSHCGGCNNACQTGGGGMVSCVDSQCSQTCSAPYADCTSTPGCETNTDTNVNHCGGCNVSCPNRPNSSRTCSDGSCGIKCNNGWANCDSNLANGCELNLNTQTGPVCGSAIYLGTVSGDTNNTPPLTITRRGEGTFRIRVTEDYSGWFDAVYLSAHLALTSPPGTDYDIKIYTSSACTTPVDSSMSTGVDVVRSCRHDSLGSTDSYDIYIEIIHWGPGGSSCDNWTLKVTGNVVDPACE